MSTNADRAGAPTHVRLLAKALADAGAQVSVVFGEHGPIQMELADRGIQTHIVSSMRSNFNAVEDLKSCWELLRIVQKVSPDLLHVHSAKAAMVGRIAAVIEKVPVIYTVHGWGFGPGRRRAVALILGVVERALKPFTELYLAVSEADTRAGAEVLKIPSERIRTVHNGIEDVPYQADPGSSRTVIMVARHSPPKDYATLFRAIDGLDCDLWCVGCGTDTREFRGLAQSLAPKTFPRISFFGSRPDVDSILPQCGVFALSSAFEGLPISIIEAMRAGLPVVASDVGGVRELVRDSTNGYLVAPGSSNSLREGLSALLENQQLRSVFGANGRETFLARFNAQRMLGQIAQSYECVLARPK